MDHIDIAIAGGGIIGLACAFKLATAPGNNAASMVILERDSAIGQHISSRNSEVIHAGIYYAKNSLKAALCVDGRQQLYGHCKQYDVSHRRLGKLIVAQQGEEGSLESIQQRAEDNGVDDLELLDGKQLRALQEAVQGEAALLSPSTGIVDSHGFMLSLLHQAQRHGVELALHSAVQEVEIRDSGGFVVRSLVGRERQPYSFSCNHFINAAGLQAQQLAGSIQGLDPGLIPSLYPCKGDYFLYSGSSPVSMLVYPVPESNVQGLGVHGSLDMAGQLRFGPDSHYVEELDYQVDGSKRDLFARAVQRYLPAIDGQLLQPAYSGIRPKLAGPGQPQADFCIQDSGDHGIEGLLQLFGIESPGLTASLAIADRVVAALQK